MFVTTSYTAVRIKYENACKELTTTLAHIEYFINGKYYYCPLGRASNITAGLNLVWRRWEVVGSGLGGE